MVFGFESQLDPQIPDLTIVPQVLSIQQQECWHLQLLLCVDTWSCMTWLYTPPDLPPGPGSGSEVAAGWVAAGVMATRLKNFDILFWSLWGQRFSMLFLVKIRHGLLSLDSPSSLSLCVCMCVWEARVRHARNRSRRAGQRQRESLRTMNCIKGAYALLKLNECTHKWLKCHKQLQIFF